MGKNEASTFINHQNPHQLENQFAIINSQLELTIDRPQPIAFEASTFIESKFHNCRIQLPKNQVYVCNISAKLRVVELISCKILTTFLWKLAPCHGKQSVFPRIPSGGLGAARTPSSGTRFQPSCSSLDRVQSVMPSRVHHGGASAEQKAWVRAALRVPN